MLKKSWESLREARVHEKVDGRELKVEKRETDAYSERVNEMPRRAEGLRHSARLGLLFVSFAIHNMIFTT